MHSLTNTVHASAKLKLVNSELLIERYCLSDFPKAIVTLIQIVEVYIFLVCIANQPHQCLLPIDREHIICSGALEEELR